MPSQTNEQALEAAIQETLCGTTIEKIKEQDPDANIAEESEQYLSGNGYYIGDPDDFDAIYAIDKRRFWSFLEETQKEELEKLQRHGDWKLKILERLDRMIIRFLIGNKKEQDFSLEIDKVELH